MIQVESLLTIIDNSGCRTGRCIKVLERFRNKWGCCGDLILVAIQKLKKGKEIKIKKGDLHLGVILRTKSKFRRRNLNFINFKENSIALLTKQFRPMGTRLKGPVLRELRKSKFMKLASISRGFV